MRLRNLAFANLSRRKGKALFLSAGIAIGIGTVVALLTLNGSIEREIGEQMDRYGANIVVVPQSNSLALDYGGVSVSGVSFDTHQLHQQDVEKVRHIRYRERLSAVAPKLLGQVEIEGHQALLAGVDFAQELRLKQWWRIVGHKPQAGNEVLVGYDVARATGVAVSSADAVPHKVTPGGTHHPSEDTNQFRVARESLQIGAPQFRVAGVIAPTGGVEDRMVFAALPLVQAALKKPGQISVIEVSALCKDCPVEDIVAQIRETLPHAKVSAIQQAVQARAQTVERLTRFSWAVSFVVLIIGALMIFTTMTSSVVERTKEIGVLRAIGFRRTHIIRGLLLEVTLISAAGGLLGWVLGLAAGWGALPYFSETGAGVPFNPWLLGWAITAALVIGTVSSIYPVLRASKLDPSDAVRSI